jgi:hypothetical protein
MNLFRALSDLEANDHVHLSRLLILISVFAGDDGIGTIEGLTKLAKLDFLLRYPTYLERALRQRGKPTRRVEVAEHERLSVESSMVRFRYGPWDFRYRRFINLLVAKGLAEVNIKGRTIEVGLTSTGVEVADRLSNDERFSDIARRARLLKTHFDYEGTYLMKLIYQMFPEITTLRLGEEIRP